VLARYFLSTLVYGEVRGATLALDEVSRSLLVPDLTVYLHARPEVRARRMGGRGNNTAEDAHSLTPEWERALDAGYRRRAQHHVTGKFLPVDVSDITPSMAVAEIASALREDKS
jgi:thymidylate kinase